MASLGNKIFTVRNFLTEAGSRVNCRVVHVSETSHTVKMHQRFYSSYSHSSQQTPFRSCEQSRKFSSHHNQTSAQDDVSKTRNENNIPNNNNNNDNNNNKEITVQGNNVREKSETNKIETSAMKLIYSNLSKLTAVYDSEMVSRALNSISLELPKSFSNPKDYWLGALNRINFNFKSNINANKSDNIRNVTMQKSQPFDFKSLNATNCKEEVINRKDNNNNSTKDNNKNNTINENNINLIKNINSLSNRSNIFSTDDGISDSEKNLKCESFSVDEKLDFKGNINKTSSSNNNNNNSNNNNEMNLDDMKVSTDSTSSSKVDVVNSTSVDISNEISNNNNNTIMNNINNNNNDNNNNINNSIENHQNTTITSDNSKANEITNPKTQKSLNLSTQLSTYGQNLTDQISSTASGAVTVTVGAIKNLSNYWPTINISLPKSLSFSQEKPDLDIEELKQLTSPCIPQTSKTTTKQQQQQNNSTTTTTSPVTTTTMTTTLDHSATIATTSKENKELKFRVANQKVDWESIDSITYKHIYTLKRAIGMKDEEVAVDVLQELCQHFVQFSRARCLAEQTKLIPTLLRMRSELNNNTDINNDINNNISSINKMLVDYINQALCLLGYVEPLRHGGLRVLTLDGGGTRGLITINILKQLERHTGKRIYQLFDYVCGVSTGALIGVISCAFRLSLSKTEDIYKKFSQKMFARNRLAGVGKLFMSHAYYDTEFWEGLLQNNIGNKSFVDTMMDPECPKLSIVSTLMNAPRVQNYLFRNYNHPSDRQSRYWGSVEHRLWQSIRASSAAPGYFEEYELGGLVHQDGGLLTNNPTAIALHECKLLWPSAPIQCIVSIGTGKYEAKSSPDLAVKSSLKAKIMKIIESATDTEAVHMVLHDLLPPSTYFRFNPPLSEGFLMDETREEKWLLMQADSQMYCRKNQVQLENVAKQLMLPKSRMDSVKDWTKLKLRTTLDY